MFSLVDQQTPAARPFNSVQNVRVKIAALVFVFLLIYMKIMASLVKTWLGHDDYSHGFIVPFISLYFIYHKRDKLKKISIQPNIFGGLVLTSMGGLLLLLGNIIDVTTVQQISLIVVIPGLVLMLLGTEHLKALALPLAYFVFMIPILDPFIEFDKIHWPFQLFTATLAAQMLKIINIPVFQNAQYLELPNITLEVANACSGVRYLISIIALGIPVAYFTQRTWLKRIILITLAVAIGILTNPVRVALIGAWVYNGSELTHGPLHILQGLSVSVVGFMFLFAGAWGLSTTPFLNGKESHKSEELKPWGSMTADMKRFNLAWLLALLLLLSFGAYLRLYNPKPVLLKNDLKSFPLAIGDWKGENVDVRTLPVKLEGADRELVRVYKNQSGDEVEVYIGYFESQRKNKSLIHHTLQDFYKNSGEILIPQNSGNPIRINKTIFNNKNQASFMLYWYDLNGRIVANKNEARILTAFDGLLHRHTNGAIIIVSGSIDRPDDMERLLNYEMGFAGQILPILKNYIP